MVSIMLVDVYRFRQARLRPLQSKQMKMPFVEKHHGGVADTAVEEGSVGMSRIFAAHASHNELSMAWQNVIRVVYK